MCRHQHNYARLLPLYGNSVESDCVSGVNQSIYTNCSVWVDTGGEGSCVHARLGRECPPPSSQSGAAQHGCPLRPARHIQPVPLTLTPLHPSEELVIVVAGSPGCNQDTGKGKSPIGVATFIREYGYGHLTVFNTTHVWWGWEQTGLRDLSTGRFKEGATWADEFWMIKDRA